VPKLRTRAPGPLAEERRPGTLDRQRQRVGEGVAERCDLEIGRRRVVAEAVASVASGNV
jgi:hypothetical protein